LIRSLRDKLEDRDLEVKILLKRLSLRGGKAAADDDEGGGCVECGRKDTVIGAYRARGISQL
jgi:hypothetical protein